MNWVLLLLVNYRIQEKIEKEKKRDEKKRYENRWNLQRHQTWNKQGPWSRQH